ncbi:uncharacterized protein LOC115231989 [Octopus sinensis]|uniref:Uncharacterized protein LOC115231989 n=1 Tax=Octopus sinensis TaxID=2607531 RepID=A0A6P7U9U3_9MOLL|nr:uncharacterized protein LOC115231989 [Octopus sinensis]
MFHSEVEPIPILDECCRELQLDMDRRLSGIVVLSYLASQGASLYHHNNKKMTPLDYIENQHLKEKLKTFLQSLCRWCQEKRLLSHSIHVNIPLLVRIAVLNDI